MQRDSIHNLDSATERTSEFSNETKLGGETNCEKNGERLEKDTTCLEMWANTI